MVSLENLDPDDISGTATLWDISMMLGSRLAFLECYVLSAYCFGPAQIFSRKRFIVALPQTFTASLKGICRRPLVQMLGDLRVSSTLSFGIILS